MSSQQLRITLAGREHVTEAGTTAGAAFDSVLGAAPDVIAARVNGAPRDLAYVLADGDVVEPVLITSDEGHAILRHSTAHVMAQAVQELFPHAKLGIGPPVENGFYYDFDVPEPFGPDDLKAIEARMRQIVKQGQLFSRRVVTEDEARAELADEPYKQELIGLKGSPGGPRRGVGRGGRSGTDHLRQPGPEDGRCLLEGPVPRAAHPVHPRDPRVQGDAQQRRVLAGE